MKLLLALIFLVIAPKECTEQQEKSVSSTQLTSKVMHIKYEAFSRGYFNYVVFDESKMLTTTDVNRKEIDTISISKKEWNELLDIVNAIDLNILENLEAPTDKRLYDGAAHCTISITTKDNEYSTPSFDEGFPPEQIKILVNKMLSISEKHLKH